MTKPAKTLYELAILMRAAVNAAGLQIHTIRILPQQETSWTAEYEAEGYRQSEYADQFAQFVAGMQNTFDLKK